MHGGVSCIRDRVGGLSDILQRNKRCSIFYSEEKRKDSFSIFSLLFAIGLLYSRRTRTETASPRRGLPAPHRRTSTHRNILHIRLTSSRRQRTKGPKSVTSEGASPPGATGLGPRCDGVKQAMRSRVGGEVLE